MEESRMAKHRLGYEKIMRAIGRFCQEQQLDEICLIEFDKGFVLQGLKVEPTGEGYVRHMASFTWSYEQIARMVR